MPVAGRALVLLAGMAVLVFFAPVAAETPRAERPIYSLGEKWVHADDVDELIRIEKDLCVFAASRGREIHLTRVRERALAAGGTRTG